MKPNGSQGSSTTDAEPERVARAQSSLVLIVLQHAE
jgi:hypothetical protein